MTSISATDTNVNQANYNAVKIKINKPKTIIPEGFKNTVENNGIYNAVNIEVEEPSVEVKRGPKHKSIYDYPQASGIVTYDMAGIEPVYIVDLPVPLAYQANLINNRTFIAADIAMNDEKPATIVPEPNVTTVDAEKVSTEKVNFKGISFKGNPIEIVPPVEIKPDIDTAEVVSKLNNPNFDIQAMQMEEIAKTAIEKPEKAIPYIVTEVFTSLIDIINRDTSTLTAPSQTQIETRKKIIVNEIVKEQAAASGKKPEEVELPYNLTKEEMISAATISPMEQAERNKEYALYTIAVLAKIYADEIQKETGNIVPLTDLPGISDVVDTLRFNENSGVKIAAIDALRYIARPEYNDELEAILTLATKDNSEIVARNAVIALKTL